MTPLRRSRLFLGLGLFTVAAGITISAQGQPAAGVPVKKEAGKADAKKKDDRDWTEAITLPVDREDRNSLDAVLKYVNSKKPVSAEDWTGVVTTLQRLLDGQADKFVDVTDDSGRVSKVSIKIEASRIIGLFNEDGRKFYLRLIGPVAEEKLKEALDQGDMGLLAEVSQRYLHTKAGAEATIRLGSWHLDRGRYQQAARTFKTLLLRNPNDELPPALLFKAALAYKRQGDEPEFAKAATKYWEMFEKLSGRGNVAFGSVSIPFEKLKTEYEKPLDKNSAIMRLIATEWGGFRGDPTNNGVGKGSAPLLESRFTYKLLEQSEDFNFETKKAGFEVIADRLGKAFKQIEAKKIAPIPGSFPLAANNKVFFRGYDGIYCLATKEDKTLDPPVKPGELLWKTETDYGLLQMVRELGPRTMTDQFLNFYTNGGPYTILFNNPLLGAMSHDGANLYYIDDLAIPPHPQQFAQNINFDGRPISFGIFQEPVYFNKLQAVDLETGKRIWKLGERTPNAGNTGAQPPAAPVKETAETLLADCLFLGPPLPLGGKLYVVIEKDGDLRLVCLDTTKLERSSRSQTNIPTLVWSQIIGQPNGRLPNDSLRRFQAIHLAYADGMMVVPTNSGAVLGIDLFSHSLIWAANYRSNKSLQGPQAEEKMIGMGRRPFPGNPNGAASFDTIRERWQASAPIISNGKVVFTSFDSDTVECVDLQDGRSVWSSPIVRQDGDVYVAGVFDDKVMIVGKGYVRFHSLATGALLKEPLATGVPTGVGVATKDRYYVPILASKEKSPEPGIVCIDTKNMLLRGTSRSRKKENPGNLLFFEGDVYSLSPYALSAFPQLDVKIRETQERLAKNDVDPVGLLDFAMLQHDDGRLPAAIDNYRKCLANKPNEETRAKGREKLFEAITELLLSDFNSGEKLLAEYKKLCEVEIPEGTTEAQRKLLAEEELRRKSNFFCLVAKGKENQGKLLDAFENYMAFGTLAGNKEMVAVIDDPNANARPDVWARGRIENMIKKATPEQRKPLEDKVVDEWNQIRKTNDVEKLRGFVKVFGGMFESGKEAQIMLADKLALTGNEEDVRESEYMLLSLRDGDDRPLAAKAIESLARLYENKGLFDDAYGMTMELNARFGNTPIKGDKTGADFMTDIRTDKRYLPYLEPLVSPWTHKRLKGTEVSGGTYDGRANSIEVDVGPDALPFFKRNRLSVDMMNRSGNGWSLKLSDRFANTDIFNTPGFGNPQWIYQMQQYNIPYRFVQVKGHIAVVTMHGANGQTGQPIAKVYAFDMADRKKLWETDLFGASPNQLLMQQGMVNQQIEVDGYRVFSADGWSMKVGQQWLVESTYTVVLTRDGLVAKDNARGTVLWTRNGMSPRTHIVGDREHVFSFDVNADGAMSIVRCFRAADGVEIPLPASIGLTNYKRVKFMGRLVLANDDTPGKKSVRLYDLLSGKDVWKRDLPKDSWIVTPFVDGVTGYVNNDGEFVVISTVDGKDVFKGKLDSPRRDKHLEKLNDVFLFGDESRYFVMLNKQPAQRPINYNFIFSQSISSQKVNGVMYAFNKSTGKMLWHTLDEVLEDQQIILNHFGTLPIILAAAHQQKQNPQGFVEQQTARVIAIDKETGAFRYAKSSNYQGQYHSLTIDPKTGIVELQNTANYRVRFAPDEGNSVSAGPQPTQPSDPAPATADRIRRIGAPIRVAPLPAPPIVIKD